MSEQYTNGWMFISGDEWRRGVDGARVVRKGDAWEVQAPSRTPAGNVRDAETGRRLADVGQFAAGGVLPVYELPDDAALPALVDAIRHMHGLEALWLESVPVKEEHEGQTVWEGHVQVFAVEHPKANRVFAWSHQTDAGKRLFHAVLGVPPVTGAVEAVRVAIVGQTKNAQS